MEVKLAERGQIVIPKAARDKLGLVAGTKMDVSVERGQLILRKKITLDLSKWLGCAKAEKLSTNEVMEELRGRPLPWKGSAEDHAILAMPQETAVATLKKRRKK